MNNLFIPALGGIYEKLACLSYPLIRITAGLFLIPHGATKLFGWFGGDPARTAEFFSKIGLEPAGPLVTATGIVEFFGGICLVLGLLTRPAAAAIFVLLIVAVERVHLAKGFFIYNGGYEHALMWAFIVLAILFRGAGAFSIDRSVIGKEF
ncbi:MAG: DoxX family protein [Alphaproteobacteria bacterium]|nr:DoxX family protein [Alphaproteobacteria bacterium]